VLLTIRLTMVSLLTLMMASRLAAAPDDAPAFSSVLELEQGFRLLYEQKFTEARAIFQQWASQNLIEPFGQVAIAASWACPRCRKLLTMAITSSPLHKFCWHSPPGARSNKPSLKRT